MVTIGAVDFGGIIEVFGLLLIFILILVIAYFTSKWIGLSGLSGTKNKNIKVIETYKINQNKYIQIIKLGNKYVAIAISKDQIEYLTEIDEESIVLSQVEGTNNLNFLQILKTAKQARDKNKSE